jgi:hypothetical protein
MRLRNSVITCIDYLKKKAVSLNSHYYFQAYKQCKNQSTKCKESWQTINELLNRKSKTTAINENESNQIMYTYCKVAMANKDCDIVE